MCRFIDMLRKKPDLIVVGSFVKLSRADFVSILKKAGYGHLNSGSPMDAWVHLPSKSQLDQIAKELVYPADWYQSDLMDCDDYALQAQIDAGRKYLVTVRLGVGKIPEGAHAFAIAVDQQFNVWVLEPNAGYPWAGVWFKPGEHGYELKEVFV